MMSLSCLLPHNSVLPGGLPVASSGSLGKLSEVVASGPQGSDLGGPSAPQLVPHSVAASTT